MKRFYIGLHHPSDAWPFKYHMISVNALRGRKSNFRANNWILDSAAFTELKTYGAYRHTPAEYVEQIKRWCGVGNLQVAVSQDYMCEPFIIAKTGLSVKEHQKLTIERYLAIRDKVSVYVMPVLQGFEPDQYASHLQQYGKLLIPGQWVGVGSVCKRNGNPDSVEDVLLAIVQERQDLKLHGFGLKKTAIARPTIRELLYSCDSAAWSEYGRRNYKLGKDRNDPRLALEYCAEIELMSAVPSFVQPQLFNWWID